MTEHSAVSKQWKLVRRPVGTPVPDDFEYETVTLPPLEPGEVRVANEFLSVDPYMRGRMNDMESYIPPFELDKAMLGGAVGRVIESRSPDLATGDLVEHMKGWRDVAQGKSREFSVRRELSGLPSSLRHSLERRSTLARRSRRAGWPSWRARRGRRCATRWPPQN